MRKQMLSCRLRFETLETRRLLAFDPTPLEQELLLLVNRMRTNPQAELAYMVDRLSPIHSADPDINNALQYFKVDGSALQSQWNTLTPVQPLAWNEALYNGAHGHNAVMIAQGQQSHQLPGEPSLGARLTAAGYDWNAVAENIYCYAESPLFAHAGFAIDWGFGSGGMQTPPGHRINLMNGTYREAGIAISTVNSGPLGPLVVTQDFGNRFNFGHAFVVGAIWNDSDDSGWYNAGEGLGGVSIEFTKAGSAPVLVSSMSAGGYQAQLAPGTYTVRAFGGSLPTQLTSSMVIGSSNVMLNFVKPEGVPPVAVDDRAATRRDTAISIDVRGNDHDVGTDVTSANIEIVATASGSQVLVNQSLGVVTYTPPPGLVGGTSFSYRLRSSAGFLSNTVTVQVAVSDPLSPRHNPIRALDVNFDGLITPLDVALVVSVLNARGAGDLPEFVPGESAEPFWDTTGDHQLAPLDALLIINHLNAVGSSEPSPDEYVRPDTIAEEVLPPAAAQEVDFSPWLYYWWADEAARNFAKRAKTPGM